MMKKCDNGHIYDGNENQDCPYCGKTPNITGFQKSPYDNGFISVDGLENIPKKIISDENVVFYQDFGGQYLIDGKYANGEEHLIEYNSKKNIIEEKKILYYEAVKGDTNIVTYLELPKRFLFEDDMIDYAKEQKPEWEWYLNDYRQRIQRERLTSDGVSTRPPLMGLVVEPPKNNNKKLLLWCIGLSIIPLIMTLIFIITYFCDC